MNSPKQNVLPFLSPYRIQIKAAKARQKELMISLRQKEDNMLFKNKGFSSSKNLNTISLSPRAIETRSEFFSSLKKLPVINRMNAEPTGLTVTFLNECQSKGLNPIPIGLSKGIGPSVDVKNYGMGDNYAEAFSLGLKNLKTLEKLNINTNSLTPRGTSSVLSNIQYQPVKELSLINNAVDHKTMSNLVILILKPFPTLKYLNLENTGVTDQDIGALCDALANDRTLTFLGIARNSLGPASAKAIKLMLHENHYLKKIDLHWNNIKDEGALQIFEGLCINGSLKEIDMSWNNMGKNADIKVITKISECFPSLQGLAHLDLSFNYFTAQHCEIFNQGLALNHEILGIHIVGNEGNTDSEGFLYANAQPILLEDSHLFTRIFQESKKHKKYLKSDCWLCEKWVESTFEYILDKNSQEHQKISVFIHLACDDFKSDLMKSEDNRKFTLTRVVPQGALRFFFSINGVSMRSASHRVVEVLPPIEREFRYSDKVTMIMTVSLMNIIEVHGTPCDYKYPFRTLPRRPRFDYNPPTFKLYKVQWSIGISLFKDYKVLDDTLAAQCLEFDWKQSRLDALVKSVEDQESLKAVLRENYKQLIETFKHLATQSANEYPSIGSNVFTELLNQCGFIDSLYEISDLGVNWNSVIVPKVKQPYNPGNALVRYEFIELLVRVAYDRYLRNKLCKTISEAFKLMLSENLEKNINSHNSQTWRATAYFTEEVDVVLKAYKPILESAYKAYSGKKATPGQKPFMSLEEFKQLCNDSSLGRVPARELDACYFTAMAVQVDELYEKKHLEMSFVEFLEALCRVANYWQLEDFEHEEGVSEAEIELKHKVEKSVRRLIKICPKYVQDNFALPTENTYKNLMFKVEKFDQYGSAVVQ